MSRRTRVSRGPVILRRVAAPLVIHDLPLERATLHGHFSVELPPVLTIEPGDTVRLSTLDAGWGLEAPHLDGSDRREFAPRDPDLDAGHALIGPIAVRGAREGQTLVVLIDELRVGSYGRDARAHAARARTRAA